MANTITKLAAAITLFFKFFGPMMSWILKISSDAQVTAEEVKSAVEEFWPVRDAEGKPAPINVPFVGGKK